MSVAVLLDTGPLVAFLSEADTYHQWAREQWKSVTPPLLTCEPVFTEAAFLLQRQGLRVEGLFELVQRGVIQLDFSLRQQIEAVFTLIKRFGDVPMSVADACLVRMSELISGSRIFTLDRDFRLYRRHGRQTIPLVAPW